MLPKDGKVKDFVNFFPVIGRGSIDHDTISHKKVEEELDRAFYRTFKEWLCHLLGWW